MLKSLRRLQEAQRHPSDIMTDCELMIIGDIAAHYKFILAGLYPVARSRSNL